MPGRKKTAAAARGDGVDDITGVVDVKVLGDSKAHVAPLLEMLILLEGVQFREEADL